MGKISAKSVTYSILSVLLWHFSSPVAAVDIIFYEATNTCSGAGYSFSGIGSNICCEVSAKDGGSVLVTSASSSVASSFYRNGGCTTKVGNGNGNFCLEGGQFTGAVWEQSRRRSLLNYSPKCNSQMKPDGVVYSENGMKGYWILTTDNAVEIYSQMQNIPNAEKANWLQSRGASYTQLGSESDEELFLASTYSVLSESEKLL